MKFFCLFCKTEIGAPPIRGIERTYFCSDECCKYYSDDLIVEAIVKPDEFEKRLNDLEVAS